MLLLFFCCAAESEQQQLFHSAQVIQNAFRKYKVRLVMIMPIYFMHMKHCQYTVL